MTPRSQNALCLKLFDDGQKGEAALTDQIGGWTTDGVGQGYGSGYPISVLQEWLIKVN